MSFLEKKILESIDLQYCNYCHQIDDFSSIFVIHYINLWMKSIPQVDELKLIGITIFVNLSIRNVIRKASTMHKIPCDTKYTI